MKRKIFLSALALALCFAGYSQNFMVIDSEKVFKASSEYIKAVAQIDAMAEAAQKKIDDTFAEIEQMYNTYQSQKQYLSVQAREARENTIIEKEKEINKYQEDTFGDEGTLIKKRMETIKPIQDKLFAIINNYAKANNFQLVLDTSTSLNMLYYSPAIDKTEQIITLIK